MTAAQAKDPARAELVRGPAEDFSKFAEERHRETGQGGSADAVDDQSCAVVRYSRGRNLRDVSPVQHEAADFDALIATLDADRAPAKSGAAYICAPMNGVRSAVSACPVRFLAIDADGIAPEAWTEWREWWHPFHAAAWETHSSRPDVPRERVIVELDRPATRDEVREAGARLCNALEAQFGAAVKLDRATLRTEQPILVPPVGVMIARYFGDPLVVAEVSPLAFSLRKTTQVLHKTTQDDLSRLASSYVGGELPPSTSPDGPGARNRCLFELARVVKAKRPDATEAELREIALAWHRKFEDVIATSEPAVSVADLQRGFAAVHTPKGSVLQSIIKRAPEVPLPARFHELGYGSSAARLMQSCALLARNGDSGAFFLACRAASELCGLHFTDAAAVLRRFIADDILELVEPGRRGQATRYRLGKAWTASPPP